MAIIVIFNQQISRIASNYQVSSIATAIIIQSRQRRMPKPTSSRSKNKSLSKSTSKGKIELNRLRDLQRPHEDPSRSTKPKSKTKSSSKCKSSHRHSKDSLRDHHDPRPRPLDKVLPKQNLFIQNRRRVAASEDKPEKSMGKKDRFVRQRNQQQDNRRSSSRKDSKRSTDNQNEETLIERLKAENEYYKKAFLTSRESMQRLEKYLKEEKVKRSHEKEWFKYQIDNLRRQLTTEKLQLGHIFTFDSFHHQDISNMIIETENQGSSLLQAPDGEENAEILSELSIDSK